MLEIALKITEKLNYFLFLLNLSVKYRKLLFNQSYPMRPIFGSKWDNLIYLLVPPPLSVKEVEEESIPEMARDFIFERRLPGDSSHLHKASSDIFHQSKACSQCHLCLFIDGATSFGGF